jgi:hypothetical protein
MSIKKGECAAQVTTNTQVYRSEVERLSAYWHETGNVA